MFITKKTIEKKQGKKWVIDSVIDNNVVNVLLNDDLLSKYVLKGNMIKTVKYSYGKIIVNYGNGTRAIYE